AIARLDGHEHTRPPRSARVQAPVAAHAQMRVERAPVVESNQQMFSARLDALDRASFEPDVAQRRDRRLEALDAPPHERFAERDRDTGERVALGHYSSAWAAASSARWQSLQPLACESMNAISSPVACPCCRRQSDDAVTCCGVYASDDASTSRWHASHTARCAALCGCVTCPAFGTGSGR